MLPLEGRKQGRAEGGAELQGALGQVPPLRIPHRAQVARPHTHTIYQVWVLRLTPRGGGVGPLQPRQP